MRWKNRLLTFLPWLVVRDTIHGFIIHEGLMMAGYLSYVALMAFFPFLIFLTALAGFVGETELGTEFIAFIFDRMPMELAAVLRPAVDEVVTQNRPGLLTVSILLSLWIISAAPAAVRTALDRAFHSERRHPFWWRGVEPLIVTIVAAAAILLGVAITVFGPPLLAALAPFLPLEDWALVIGLMQSVAPPILLFLAVVVLYWNLCSVSMDWSSVWPGALFTVALWLTAAGGFSIYLSHFNRFPKTYGSLGGAALALAFFYVMAAIFLLGAELNAALSRHRARL